MPSSDAGVQFPVVGQSRSTTATGREAFAVAGAAVDDALARRIRAVTNWRKDYVRPTRDLVALGGRNPAAAQAVSAAGLEFLASAFRYVSGGVEHPLADACTLPGGFATRSFVGGADRRAGWSVPYRGRDIEGSDLRRQVRRWVAADVAEPSFATAMDAVIDHPEWFDLSAVQVLLLGAGAELGPLRQLLEWGATVLAVDLPDARRWERIIAAVRGTPGVLHVPVGKDAGIGPASEPGAVAAVAGANLLTQLPDLAAWASQFAGDLVVANYLYADGATNVRLSMAADALGQHLIASRPGRIMLAFLATPTDAFQVSADVILDARDRWRHARLARMTRLPLKVANLFQPNYPDLMRDDDGMQYGIADCIVPQQGPNYVLAKRMQRWRAVAGRSAGVRVSLNVAPPTRTQSVVKNRALAAAYAGAGRFGIEIFEPDTCNAIMAALLVRDLRDRDSAADPAVPLHHPSALFTEAACHGGLWRSAYSPRSVLGVAAAIGMIERAA